MTEAETPLISVHVPAFNAESTIELALTSLLHQTHSHWEAIVVDDGSTDRTGDVVMSFSDPRIKYHQLERNCGRGFARQTCLEKGQGDFVTFLDADDFYHPRKLELQLVCFKSDSRLDLVSCRMGAINEFGGLGRIRPKSESAPMSLVAGKPFPFPRAPSMIRSRAIYGHAYDSKLNFAEDTVFLEAAMARRWMYCLPKVLYYYTEHQSLSKRKHIAMSLGGLKARLRHRDIKSPHWWKDLGLRGVKTVAKILMYPFVSEAYYLRRRGCEASVDEVEQFKRTLSELLADMGPASVRINYNFPRSG